MLEHVNGGRYVTAHFGVCKYMATLCVANLGALHWREFDVCRVATVSMELLVEGSSVFGSLVVLGHARWLYG